MKLKSNLLATGICLAAATAGDGQPIITNQPHAQATALGTTATFTVAATGAEPLTYQWQKEQGRGFFDLADHTNAVLTLTNAQLSDRADYRVVVSDSGGSVTSAVAPLYVMSFAVLSERTLLDDFNDNRLTNWSTYGQHGSGLLIESNQQFTVYGYWPGKRTTNTDMTYCIGGLPLSSCRTIPEGQTLEWRVDLVHLDDNAANAVKILVGTPSGGYGFFKWGAFILLDKFYWTGDATQISAFTFEKASVRNSNVVLAVALSRVSPNVILTARVLDKENPDVVLYERSVVDTPNADPTLTTADIEVLSGMSLAFGPELSGAPFTYAGEAIGLFQYTDGTAPAATVTYDNFELWTWLVVGSGVNPEAHW